MTLIRKTKGSAGADLTSAETVLILPNSMLAVDTGYKLPPDIEGDVFFGLYIRSSIAFKKGLMLVNSVGVIDKDYPDTIKVGLYNRTDEPVAIQKGERIAQLIPQPFIPLFPCEDVERVGGIGSTNKERGVLEQ